MSKKPVHKKPGVAGKKPQESVFKEAWENMNEDMARVMPEFLSNRLRRRKGKIWTMVLITLVELVVLGAAGKFIFDWFAK